MKPFRKHNGWSRRSIAHNVDTDQIIPKQFLKRIERTGFGEFLFYDWRRTKDGAQDPSLSLNHPRYKGASILVAGKNFGCGSSREHAVWALADFGFRAVIASLVRGHLRQQLREEWRADRRARRRGSRGNRPARTELARLPARHRPGAAAKSTMTTASPPLSRSMTSPGIACSKAWMTSA